jgi:hypothetical protein
MILIESIGLFPVASLNPFRLIPFVEETITHHKVIHLRSHETPVCIVRATHNGLPPNVKARIDDYPITGSVLKTLDQLPILGVCLFMDSLESCRIINMGNSRNI